MFENIGWIVEAKIRKGQRAAFEAVMNEIVAATIKEKGTLNYQYYVSDDGCVMVYERFTDIESAHIHVTNWDTYVERWIAAAEPSRMVHLGDTCPTICASVTLPWRHSGCARLVASPDKSRIQIQHQETYRR